MSEYLPGLFMMFCLWYGLGTIKENHDENVLKHERAGIVDKWETIQPKTYNGQTLPFVSCENGVFVEYSSTGLFLNGVAKQISKRDGAPISCGSKG